MGGARALFQDQKLLGIGLAHVRLRGQQLEVDIGPCERVERFLLEASGARDEREDEVVELGHNVLIVVGDLARHLQGFTLAGADIVERLSNQAARKRRTVSGCSAIIFSDAKITYIVRSLRAR